ncbi:hypothetical protein TrST_g13797 [Triparma strigata]|uniref:DNA mismatch repair protein S5 domain-containing protein n=1 Tax=Triparma strigata TaxID=1606541 RepID=A0A9W7APS3_9STRA|nr:hypothetical protein TrST_g13797 [Triparma strigata]
MTTIQALPQEIVDRIAAGEIVQRPASIVKELVENSLDSGATSIEVSAVKGGLESIQISDDGCGMTKDDLPLAAVRFATSKLRTFQDLKSIRTFGFRGEALASASMVSHLSILSKRAADSVAHKCQYSDGAALPNTLKPSAGGNGTTVKVDDLFYNVPSRKRSFKRDSDEYNKILDVVQRYSIHRAGNGVGFVCKKKNANAVDLNTKSLQTVKTLSLKRRAKADLPEADQTRAKKEAIGHVFGSALAKELGLITNASYCVKSNSSAFVFFINDRLVQSTGLQKAVEAVYHDLLPTRGRPFVYLSLDLPGPHVDVNVHPTKKEVAFLHEDRLCEAVAIAIRSALSSVTSSRNFTVASVVPSAMQEKREKEKQEREKERERQRERQKESAKRARDLEEKENNDNDDDDDFEAPKRPKSNKQNSGKILSLDSFAKPDLSSEPKRRQSYDPSKVGSNLVRTSSAAPTGALEPFLRRSNKSPQAPSASSSSSNTNANAAPAKVQHAKDCELYNLDISVPGAFSLVCRCMANKVVIPPPNNRRPSKVVASPCGYKSIQDLRNDVLGRTDQVLSEKLKTSTYVGAISRQRSLIQVGVELLMIHHYDLAKELFYQLALARFGNVGKGSVGGEEGIDVLDCVLQAMRMSDGGSQGLRLSENSQSSKVSDYTVNKEEAADMVKLLESKQELLSEYFGLNFKMGEGGRLKLTTLPNLLENHSPSPHALPLFLMRLATEVDYGEERGCFESVCSELGMFYAELPLGGEGEGGKKVGEEGEEESGEFIDKQAADFVKHTLHPAFSYLLRPPREFGVVEEDGDAQVKMMATLSVLYKVFERC